jgi:4-hydroxy-tetrahydrodipicolinate synthase
MTSKTFSGLGTALVTPFRTDGSVDLERMTALVERQIQGGVDFLVPCGTTGEAVTLDAAEYEAVVSTTVRIAAGRVPVVAGAGSNSTAKTIETARTAQQCGVDGILVVGPYYNKPTQEGFFQHFKVVADAVPLPMIIYNVPGRTGSNISAETQLRIASIETVVATKEASGNPAQIMQIIAGKPEGFSVLSGDDNLALPLIALGASGIISVVSNELPGEFSRLVHAAMHGDFVQAREIHYRLMEVMDVNFIESSPIPVKTAMAMMGLLEESFRLPMVPITDANRKKVRAALERLGEV